jgi:hypothetical protein
MLALRFVALKNMLVTTIINRWPVAAILFGLLLTVVWLALLIWGALFLLKLA